MEARRRNWTEKTASAGAFLLMFPTMNTKNVFIAPAQAPLTNQPRDTGHAHRMLPRAKKIDRDREVWIYSRDTETIASGLESFQPLKLLVDEEVSDGGAGSPSMTTLRNFGHFEAVLLSKNGTLIEESTGKKIGKLITISNASDLADLESRALQISAENSILVVKASDWKIIPAENLVAVYQNMDNSLLFGWSEDSSTARILLEALEIGVDGVILATSSPSELRALAKYLEDLSNSTQQKSSYTIATVTEVKPVGMGDRACIDLAENLSPGQGMVVGSFAKGLFLVHSECEESGGWINARPFRINAGPVHAYVQIPGGKTRYISELKTGDEVLVHDADGKAHAALIGRMKIERRPLMLVKAVDANKGEFAILLQNAETVKLVGPSKGQEKTFATPSAGQTWRSISMAEIKPGDEVFVLEQLGARHTGVAIEETIVER